MSGRAPGRMLGIDVGERRIGVAVSEGRIAVPLKIIEHVSRAADVARIAETAREQAATAIVVGLPISMSGEEGEQAKRVRRFGEALAPAVEVPVVYHDERLSSRQAAGAAGRRERPRNAGGIHPARRRGRRRVDDLAAAVILQAHLDALEPAL